jgi:hypothetical protein
VHVGQVQVILPGAVMMIGEEGEKGDRRAVDGGGERVGVGVRAVDCDAGMFVMGVSSCVVGEGNELNEDVV